MKASKSKISTKEHKYSFSSLQCLYSEFSGSIICASIIFFFLSIIFAIGLYTYLLHDHCK